MMIPNPAKGTLNTSLRSSCNAPLAEVEVKEAILSLRTNRPLVCVTVMIFYSEKNNDFYQSINFGNFVVQWWQGEKPMMSLGAELPTKAGMFLEKVNDVYVFLQSKEWVVRRTKVPHKCNEVGSIERTS